MCEPMKPAPPVTSTRDFKQPPNAETKLTKIDVESIARLPYLLNVVGEPFAIIGLRQSGHSLTSSLSHLRGLLRIVVNPRQLLTNRFDVTYRDYEPGDTIFDQVRPRAIGSSDHR